MDRQGQIKLLKRLLHYVETKTTALAESPWRNDVAVYADPAHFRREQQILFRGHPLLMGFASDWSSPGSFNTDDYAGVPILVARGRDGKLRAFLNVCRHRGAKVAQGRGRARVFACPYHAWTYDLSGKVIGIPDERCFPEVRAERPSLAELPLCEKHGLVWVIPTPAADGSSDFDIDPWLGGLGPELASYGFEFVGVLRQARDLRDDELEDPRRYLPRRLSHRLSASEVSGFDPPRQCRRLRGLRSQSPPYLSAQEA